MKTAEEILESRGLLLRDQMDVANQLIEAMKEYAEQACKEQRRICAMKYAFESVTNDSNNYEIDGKGMKDLVFTDIDNAPQPKLK